MQQSFKRGMIPIDQTAAVLMVMFVATALQAAPIDLRIDLGNKAGETAGNWNNPGGTDPLFLTGSYPDLIDFSTGLGTGVGINFGTTPEDWSQFYGDSSGVFPDQSWLVQPATQDGAGWTHSYYGPAITLSGLVESRYLVEVVSARDVYASNSISVNGALANRTYLGTPVEDPWDVQSHGLYPGNWLIWDNVSPIVGEITIQMSTFATGMGIINAVRVVGGDPVVPEPSSLAMFGIGALGLFGYSRRRRQTSAAA